VRAVRIAVGRASCYARGGIRGLLSHVSLVCVCVCVYLCMRMSRCVQVCMLAPRLTSRDLRRTLRPASRDCAAPSDPHRAHVPRPTPARRPAMRPRFSLFPLRPTVPFSPTIHCPTSPYDPPSHPTPPTHCPTSPRSTGPLPPRF
jgi:hypothetical protein